MFPLYTYYNGAIWKLGYSNYFGNGYIKLTAALKRHPKKTFMAQTQMLKLLQLEQATVAVNPSPTDEIIEDISYKQFLINNKQSDAN